LADKRKTGTRKWAFSAFFLYLFTKLKGVVALFKFSKIGGTLLTMLLSIGAYAIAAPLPFAVGFVVLMFIHELGHSIAAKQKGLPVSAPIFIPFVGALITMKRHPRDAATEAYIAFGGPLLGSIGAAVFLVIGQWLDRKVMISLAYTGFFLNLINLLPIHPLDGGRIATAVTRWLWLLGLIGGLFVIYALGSWLFLLIWALFAWDLFQKYVWKRQRPGRSQVHLYSLPVPYEEVLMLGLPLPGEQHRRDLPFTTWSDLEGKQWLRLSWEGYLEEATLNWPGQGLVRRVETIGSSRDDFARKLSIRIRVEWEPHVNDTYYDVPVRTRWGYGIAYALLAAALGALMYATKHLL
jgi:Zn-dependent protease